LDRSSKYADSREWRGWIATTGPPDDYVAGVTNGTSRRKAEAVVVGGATLLIAAVVFPLWRPLLVAAVLAGVLSPLYEKSVAKFGGRRSLCAGLFTAATVVLILLPLAVLGTIAIREAVGVIGLVRKIIASEGVEGLIAKAPDSIEGWLHRLEKHIPTEIDRAQTQFAAGGRWALGAVSGAIAVAGRAGLKLALMLIAYFFLLRDGRTLVDWLAKATPLQPERVRFMMREFRDVARSVLGANFITGAAQAAIATGGFFIARAPSPIFFGLLTLFASLIPSVGTALVTLPVAGLVLLLGHPWRALFLAVWGLVIVGLIDNLLRPVLIRSAGRVHLHGALIFFSLIGALSAFGAVGLFLGPLALVFFLAVVRTRRLEREGLAHQA
jgi:predicted PurR-regulated permease PerM